MLQKYHKYRGRFVDLQKYCKELQRENSKAKVSHQRIPSYFDNIYSL